MGWLQNKSKTKKKTVRKYHSQGIVTKNQVGGCRPISYILTILLSAVFYLVSQRNYLVTLKINSYSFKFQSVQIASQSAHPATTTLISTFLSQVCQIPKPAVCNKSKTTGQTFWQVILDQMLSLAYVYMEQVLSKSCKVYSSRNPSCPFR